MYAVFLCDHTTGCEAYSFRVDGCGIFNVLYVLFFACRSTKPGTCCSNDCLHSLPPSEHLSDTSRQINKLCYVQPLLWHRWLAACHHLDIYTWQFCYFIAVIMKNCNRHSSHGHHGSKRRELAQHAHSRGSHAFTHTPTSTQLQRHCAKRQLSYYRIWNQVLFERYRRHDTHSSLTPAQTYQSSNTTTTNIMISIEKENEWFF